MKGTDALREYARRTYSESGCAVKSSAVIGPLGKTCGDFRTCGECREFALNAIADMIDGEKTAAGETDSWERVDRDAMKGPCEYFNRLFVKSAVAPCGECQARAIAAGCLDAQRLDIVRRCRELSEAGR